MKYDDILGFCNNRDIVEITIEVTGTTLRKIICRITEVTKTKLIYDSSINFYAYSGSIPLNLIHSIFIIKKVNKEDVEDVYSRNLKIIRIEEKDNV